MSFVSSSQAALRSEVSHWPGVISTPGSGSQIPSPVSKCMENIDVDCDVTLVMLQIVCLIVVWFLFIFLFLLLLIFFLYTV